MRNERGNEATTAGREERLRVLAEAALEALVISEGGTILAANRAFTEMFGYEPDEIVGKSVLKVVAPGWRKTVSERISAGHDEPYEAEGLTKSGGTFRAEIRGRDATYGGRAARVTAIRDVTERKATEERLRHQAHHDELTGLPNRALLLDRLNGILRHVQHDTVTLLYLDLDDFRAVNDASGHAAGDELLVAVGERLRGCFGPEAFVARIGGDEFAVLLGGPVVDAGRAAATAAGGLRAAPFRLAGGGEEVSVTASIGVVVAGAAPGRRAEDVLRDADVAMYGAKDAGKARHAVFDPGMREKAMERSRMEGDLRRAIEAEEFEVYYQPKVLLNTGTVFGTEALVRWRHPREGIVPPAKFIPLAEETGLILPLGRWVLEESCRQARDWQERYPGESLLNVSVNLSARQFRDPDLAASVAATLRKTGLRAHSLTLEVTESVVMDDAERAAKTMHELKALGVRLAIDDFGTGYSSLSYLKRFPVDVLKVDRSFVSGLGAEDGDATEDEAIARAVVALAKSLGLGVIAEGIETAGQLRRLREMGCGLGQGYYFAKPLDGEAIRLWIERERGAFVGVEGPVTLSD